MQFQAKNYKYMYNMIGYRSHDHHNHNLHFYMLLFIYWYNNDGR